MAAANCQRVAGQVVPLVEADLASGHLRNLPPFLIVQALAQLLVSYVILVVAILTVLAVSLGIFLSTYARNELQAVQFMVIRGGGGGPARGCQQAVVN